MKQIVETTGNFMLIEPHTRETVEPNRPCVVSKTKFFSERMGVGELKYLCDVPDTVTDLDFAKVFKEQNGDAEAAVNEFRSKHNRKTPKRTVKED